MKVVLSPLRRGPLKRCTIQHFLTPKHPLFRGTACRVTAVRMAPVWLACAARHTKNPSNVKQIFKMVRNTLTLRLVTISKRLYLVRTRLRNLLPKLQPNPPMHPDPLQSRVCPKSRAPWHGSLALRQFFLVFMPFCCIVD